MKDNNMESWVQKKTNPLLLKAHNVLSSYSKATGALFSIMDHNHLSIPELFNETTTPKNTCLFCMKCQYNMDVSKNQDYIYHPCRELHIDEMKKAHVSGSPGSYMCSLGFMFWTNPVFFGKHYIGSFIASGFLYADKKETAKKMEELGKGMAKKEEILKRLSHFPQTDPHRIKSLAEIMQVCADSLSGHNSNHCETLKRRKTQQTSLATVTGSLKTQYTSGALPKYPFDTEKTFLEAIRSGDSGKGSQYLDEILGTLLFIHNDQFQNIKYKVLELAILLSRIENIPNEASSPYSNTVHEYIKLIKDAQNPEEIFDAIHLMAQYLAAEVFSFQGVQHASAMKKADLYIQNNLSRKLSLDEIAEASGLSAPYFSSIFKKEMGENLSGYLNRLRVEKAACLLKDTNQPLKKIASLCGFEDQSWFSKIFKNYTGMNPGKYRQEKKYMPAEL